ncbi:NAD(+) diphosphatase [Avibacterium sp. 20-15]|uniref:NAD(+) diphosphatase n=1 Tax=unclassified Avibacterium TaxID=2685287 RepID=UPI002026DE32|nr:MULTISPECIES: NAD(+) diphosphatase [unclassified Avibacterium]MCW9732834.1 NAD(+) diphosphatase [Avibacterium sp. 20-15]URL04975.1 NAD(+) diphosphatase [Avibacterium sp. 20-132]
MNFSMQPIAATTQGAWLLTQGSNIFLVNEKLPEGKAEAFQLTGLLAMEIGRWNDQPLWLVAEQEDLRTYTSLRSLLHLPETQFNLLNRGVEINHFLKTHRFCGKCGARMAMVKDELAVQCENSACSYRTYPVICPSIIVAVRRGKQILLANHQRHQQEKMYTTLAGFVEAGESFEQTVKREVFEETGIKVKNIRYFGSQPWAFPNSQMVGFLADYVSGEIRVQETEIQDAQWFDYDKPLPNLPPQGTIALKLINATLALCAADDKSAVEK